MYCIHILHMFNIYLCSHVYHIFKQFNLVSYFQYQSNVYYAIFLCISYIYIIYVRRHRRYSGRRERPSQLKWNHLPVSTQTNPRGGGYQGFVNIHKFRRVKKTRLVSQEYYPSLPRFFCTNQSL